MTGFQKPFDNLGELYDDRFARPATAILQELTKAGKLTPAPFDEKLKGMGKEQLQRIQEFYKSRYGEQK